MMELLRMGGSRLFKPICAILIFLLLILCTLTCGWWLSAHSPSTSETEEGGVFFHRPQIAAHLDCGRVLAGDADYIAAIPTQPRLTHFDQLEGIPMDCESIRARHYFTQQPLSAEEAEWPLAKARVVYKDYTMLEAELATSYAPQNWYCYAVDAQTDGVFRWRIHQLAACFPNVVVAPEEVNAYSSGKGTFPSWMNCLRQLARPDRKWNYVSMLQNHDVQIKTNAEMVRIFKWFDGANDVNVAPEQKFRRNTALDWGFRALNIFRDQARNERPSPDGYQPTLLFSMGLSQSSFTRPMVEFMLHELNLTTLVDRQETWDVGTDESLVATLSAAEALHAPGGFTRYCAEERQIHVPTMTRVSIFPWLVKDGSFKCKTGIWRHTTCIMGVEDLRWLATEVHHVYANKMMPEKDYGAVVCWHEHLFNETHYMSDVVGKRERSRRLNETYYRSLPQVRFQEFKRQHGLAAKELEKFQCDVPK